MAQSKLLPTEHALGDQFGTAVAFDGVTALIGAPLSDTAGDDSGSAFAFIKSGPTWVEQQRLLPSDGSQGDAFGSSLAVSGNWAFVGTPLDDDNGIDSGSVYVFARSGTVWTQSQKLLASDGSAHAEFGRALSTDGSVLLIGAPGDSTVEANAGATYVFVLNGTAWTQQQRLVVPDAAEGDRFGASVGISGTNAVVGAPFGAGSGAAYAFASTAGSFAEKQKLLPAGGAAGDEFGFSVSLRSSTLAVGAPETTLSAADAGAVYVFELSAGNWVQEKRLLPGDAGASKAFGHSVSLGTNTLLVGAPFDTSQQSFAGAAYTFTHSNSDWPQTLKFSAADGAPRDQLGVSVAQSGSAGLVGALWNDAQAIDAGAAYSLDISQAVAVPALGHYALPLVLMLAILGALSIRRRFVCHFPGGHDDSTGACSAPPRSLPALPSRPPQLTPRHRPAQ